MYTRWMDSTDSLQRVVTVGWSLELRWDLETFHGGSYTKTRGQIRCPAIVPPGSLWKPDFVEEVMVSCWEDEGLMGSLWEGDDIYWSMLCDTISSGADFFRCGSNMSRRINKRYFNFKSNLTNHHSEGSDQTVHITSQTGVGVGLWSCFCFLMLWYSNTVDCRYQCTIVVIQCVYSTYIYIYTYHIL